MVTTINSFKQYSKIGLFGLLVFCYACGGGDKDGKKTDTKSESKSDLKQNIQKVLNEVPKPSDIPYLLMETGADFDEKLPNRPDNVKKYLTTNNAAALNLGVYAADIGYVSIYEKAQDAIKYVSAAKQLSDKLQISNVLDAVAVKRFEENLKNKDSLVNIIDESLKSSDKYLKDNERNTIAAMIFTGTFVEGLYIATELVANYPNDVPLETKNQVLIPLVRIILKQEKPLNDLIKVLKSLDLEPDINDLIKSFEELDKLYKALDIEEKIKNNKGDLVLNDKTIKEITAKVKAIRTEVTK
jgi:hypothetical protein